MKMWSVSLLALLTLQSYPPPFPREGVTKVLENEHVVVWHGVFPKNRPTAVHEHRLDLVGVFFSEGRVRATMLDGSVRDGKPFGPGHVVFQPLGVIHVEESLVEGTRAVGLELKEGSDAPLQGVPEELDPVTLAPHVYRILLNNKRVRVIESIERPNESRPRHIHPGRLILQTSGCPGNSPPQRAATTFDDLRVWWVDPEVHGPATSTVPQECRHIEIEVKGVPMRMQ